MKTKKLSLKQLNKDKLLLRMNLKKHQKNQNKPKKNLKKKKKLKNQMMKKKQAKMKIMHQMKKMFNSKLKVTMESLMQPLIQKENVKKDYGSVLIKWDGKWTNSQDILILKTIKMLSKSPIL
jgi:hypothetical protein